MAANMSSDGSTSKVAIVIKSSTIDWDRSGKVMAKRGKFTNSYMPFIMPQTWDMAPERATFMPSVAAVTACADFPAALTAC